MEDKRVIELNERQRRFVIGTLNEKRNALVERQEDTDFVDETMLAVIDAPTKRERRREGRVRDEPQTR